MRNLTRRALFVVIGGTLVAMVSVLDASVVRAQRAGAVVPLPAQMAAAAQQYLPGVVGEPVPAFTIDPAIASLAAGARTFKIASGRDAGQTEQHVIAALPRDTTGTRWRYTICQPYTVSASGSGRKRQHHVGGGL